MKYSNKSIMWLVYREQVDACTIMHSQKGREYRLPELPCLSVDGFCPDTRTVYEFCGCYYHKHTCLTYRDIATMGGGTLAQRYEKKIARLEQNANAG
jgi:hypothetical protein